MFRRDRGRRLLCRAAALAGLAGVPGVLLVALRNGALTFAARWSARGGLAGSGKASGRVPRGLVRRGEAMGTVVDDTEVAESWSSQDTTSDFDQAFASFLKEAARRYNLTDDAEFDEVTELRSQVVLTGPHANKTFGEVFFDDPQYCQRLMRRPGKLGQTQWEDFRRYIASRDALEKVSAEVSLLVRYGSREFFFEGRREGWTFNRVLQHDPDFVAQLWGADRILLSTTTRKFLKWISQIQTLLSKELNPALRDEEFHWGKFTSRTFQDVLENEEMFVEEALAEDAPTVQLKRFQGVALATLVDKAIGHLRLPSTHPLTAKVFDDMEGFSFFKAAKNQYYTEIDFQLERGPPAIKFSWDDMEALENDEKDEEDVDEDWGEQGRRGNTKRPVGKPQRPEDQILLNGQYIGKTFQEAWHYDPEYCRAMLLRSIGHTTTMVENQRQFYLYLSSLPENVDIGSRKNKTEAEDLFNEGEAQNMQKQSNEDVVAGMVAEGKLDDAPNVATGNSRVLHGKWAGERFENIFAWDPQYCKWLLKLDKPPGVFTEFVAWLKLAQRKENGRRRGLSLKDQLLGGKHFGLLFETVLEKDPDYCIWVVNQNFRFGSSLFDFQRWLLERKEELDERLSKARSRAMAVKQEDRPRFDGGKQKVRNRRIIVANQSFVDIASLKGKIVAIMDKPKDGDILKGRAFKLIEALLSYHPEGEAKTKGLSGIKVDKSPNHGQKPRFIMIKEDGTEEDLSLKKCVDALELNPPYAEESVAQG